MTIYKKLGIVDRQGIVTLLLIMFVASAALGAAGHSGQVMFGGTPVPGATVTATLADKQLQAITDETGTYQFADMADGRWTIRVEMLGFEPSAKEVTVSADSPPAPTVFELKLRSFDEIAAAAAPVTSVTRVTTAAGPQSAAAQPRAAAKPGTPAQSGFQRAAVTASPSTSAAVPAAPAAASAPPASPAAQADTAADGLLINGSVNNGAASPFAQLPAFGNNRRGARSLFNGGLALILGNSAFDSRPFSFSSQQLPKPSYSDVQVNGSFAGPIKLPGIVNKPNIFLGYQHTISHNETTQTAIVPTADEIDGNFGSTPIHNLAGQAFPNNTISPISTQAQDLLKLYPAANVSLPNSPFNYQAPVLTTTHTDAFQARFNHTVNSKNQLFGVVAYQRLTTDAGNIFGFVDSTRVSGVDSTVNWSHRFSPFASVRVHYQFTDLTTNVTPNFAGRSNISGDAGIIAPDQTPNNWGPPTLSFSNGIVGLGTAQSNDATTITNIGGIELFRSRGRHNFTYGAELRPQFWNVNGEQDARGTLSFTGAATGDPFADFLLGIPSNVSIAAGNPIKHFHALGYDAYLTDDWRFRPTLTLNVGVRYEYDPPVAERDGNMSNLVLAPDFSSTRQVTGNSLMNPDRRGVEPRIAIAWRPIAGSSFVMRGGYGIYRNTNVYEPIALLLAGQPPLSTTFSVPNTGDALTLADPFVPPAVASLPSFGHTFAVDSNFRVGYAQNWQVVAQRDLPGSLTVTLTYLGAKGSHLMQEFLPNTYPINSTTIPCQTCPTGFIYLASNGSSLKNAGQIQMRRRLRAGLSASVQYTLSKATDNAGAFTGASVASPAIAQNWQDLAAEQAPSNYDQRHLLSAQFEYTTGVGVAGGGLLTGLKGTLIRGWTVTAQLTAGSGLPLTPIYFATVPGTGVTGTIRPTLTGASTNAIPAGYYLNPAAYAAPADGQWGNAGRNSVRGPQQFSLNGSLGRTFVLGDRLNLDWRLDVTNLLNQVTYASVNTIVGSSQFGLPTLANPMRRIQSTMRLRF